MKGQSGLLAAAISQSRGGASARGPSISLLDICHGLADAYLSSGSWVILLTAIFQLRLRRRMTLGSAPYGDFSIQRPHGREPFFRKKEPGFEGGPGLSNKNDRLKSLILGVLGLGFACPSKALVCGLSHATTRSMGVDIPDCRARNERGSPAMVVIHAERKFR